MSDDDQRSEEETKRCADDALKRMLQTPHKPHKPIGKKGESPAKPGQKGAPKRQLR